MLEIVATETKLVSTIECFVADWGLATEITRETALVDDLEFDSIDVIQLIVAIETAFSRRNLGFQELLMVDGRYVEDLTVGQISDFLEARILGA
ncbi:MAG: acyl carrier protein [Pseudomonadota bacterium]